MKLPTAFQKNWPFAGSFRTSERPGGGISAAESSPVAAFDSNLRWPSNSGRDASLCRPGALPRISLRGPPGCDGRKKSSGGRTPGVTHDRGPSPNATRGAIKATLTPSRRAGSITPVVCRPPPIHRGGGRSAKYRFRRRHDWPFAGFRRNLQKASFASLVPTPGPRRRLPAGPSCVGMQRS